MHAHGLGCLGFLVVPQVVADVLDLAWRTYWKVMYGCADVLTLLGVPIGRL